MYDLWASMGLVGQNIWKSNQFLIIQTFIVNLKAIYLYFFFGSAREPTNF